MEKLRKLSNLIKKTGDKIIVVDEQADPQFVIMSVDDYERLSIASSKVSGLTEDELLSKINCDIAIWKNDKEEDLDSVDEEDDIDEEDFDDNDFFEKTTDIKKPVVNENITDREIVQREIKKIDDLKKKAFELQEIAKETKDKESDERYYFEPVDDELEDL